MHDTKIGVIIRGDLETWQKLNVTAFLAAGVTAYAAETIGEQYEDGSGNTYLPVLTQPVFVYTANLDLLQRTRTRAIGRDVPMAIYTKDMFATGNDKDNRAVVKAVSADKLDIVGIAFRCDRRTFDKIINGLRLHS